jgi:hypothetical protein
MNELLGVLLTALLVGLIAFVAALLLRARQSALGYVGAGFLGMGIGAWLFSLVDLTDPLVLRLNDFGVVVPVLATFVGSLLVLLVVRLVRGRGRFGRR